MHSSPELELRDLEKHFSQYTNVVNKVKDKLTGVEQPPIRAVDGVNLSLDQNQVQGIIGESGCGKTTLIETIAGFLQPTGGEIEFKGEPQTEFTKDDWKNYRKDVQMVFQDPFNSLDPKFSVYETLKEPLKIHNISNQKEKIWEMLEQVELMPPEKYLDKYPTQLSGGENQRVSIARALILEPDVILADEPVSMLDVSTQASILNLLDELTNEFDVSMIYISHDLSTVSYICDAVNVMYLGRIVESAPPRELIDSPKHPYTQALVNAIPLPDPNTGRERTNLKGRPSDPSHLPGGCRFKDRCPERMEICDVTPCFKPLTDSHQVACHLYYEHGKEDISEDTVEDNGREGERK